jgi:FdrA protein
MSAVLNAVRKGFYLDSVALMRLSQAIGALPGVIEAGLMMATPANKRLLQEAGLLHDVSAAVDGNDLIIGVRAESDEAAGEALEEAAAQLDSRRGAARQVERAKLRSLRTALRGLPDATLALISVPGDFALAEARKAIRSGLDAMIFSDNVPIDGEVALKQEARARGRLIMGPDCGTAIINGVPLAFANRVPQGEIGIIGASGTGMQEVSSLIAQGGGGVSQAIGVGGRDLSREVGGISTSMALDLLEADAATRRVVLISKPPHPDVARAILAQVANSAKPFTICFLGASDMPLPANARAAPTLLAAAEDALGGISIGEAPAAPSYTPKTGAIVGLYSGGTLCAEAQLILMRAGRSVASNVPVPGAQRLTAEGAPSDRILDLGAEEFTRARPHPMIEPTIRNEMLRATLADPNVAVVLLDAVIGFGAHADPAGQIAAVLRGAPGDRPHAIASVTGTEDDPQVRSRQIAALKQAGALVAPSNAHAAELAAALSRP